MAAQEKSGWSVGTLQEAAGLLLALRAIKRAGDLLFVRLSDVREMLDGHIFPRTETKPEGELSTVEPSAIGENAGESQKDDG